ncbi:MAG: AAA family ATPase [Candidatus Pristimantibacillus sp.]
MIEMPGYQTLDVIGNNGDIKLYRLLRQEDNLVVIAKMTCDEYPSPATIEAFHYEYEMLRELSGKGTLEVYSLETIEEQPVLLMQNIEGCTLDRVLRMRGNTLELPALLRIAAGVTECIMQIHRVDITLNEVTPSQFIVNPDTYEVKMIDIRMCSTNLRKSPMSLSNRRPDSMLPYISPEQTGRTGILPDYRSDFYSLGVILYEWLSGSLPFELQDVLNIVYRHLASTPEPLHHRFPSIPQPISDIIAKCMEKMPDARYVSAFGIKLDLEECLTHCETPEKAQSFVLASRDISERWITPTAFYGRRTEQQSLRAALQRASDGAAEVVRVSGNGGIGKSTFVRETLRTAVPVEGLFLTVKFNSQDSALPYGGWIQMIEALIAQLFMENKLQEEVWKLRILNALDGYGQLLIEMVPKLELLIGPQPSVPTLPPVESLHRLHLIMNRFIQLFLHEDRPLVLFFDDIQWMDEASLQYLAYLLEDRTSKYLLVMLASRDDEMKAINPSSRLDKILIERRIAAMVIPLQGLELADLKQLLRDAMHNEAAEIDDLASVLLQRTEGNPFFVKQFIQDLIDSGRLSFNEISRGWQWQLPLIMEMNIPDNIISYQSDKLKLFPYLAVHTLSRAAFLGNRFDLDRLSELVDLSAQQLSEGLDIAVREHILQSIGSNNGGIYKFRHNRIQQAAYALVAEAERPDLHLRIGNLLLNEMMLSDRATIFEVVSHFNQATEGMVDSEQRLKLAELNLQAGIKAKQTTAYETALGYLRNATALLEEDSWVKGYTLTFSAFRERAETEYLCGNFAIANDLFNLLMNRADTHLDKALVCTMKIQLEVSKDNYEEVISLGRHALQLLNIDHNFDPGSFELTLQWHRVTGKMRKHSIESLHALPPMTDEVRRAAMSVLVHTANACFVVNKKGWLATSFAIIEMTLDHGMTPEASIGFMSYAVFLYIKFHQYEEVFKWGMVAYSLSKPYPTLHAKTLTAFAFCCDSWRAHDPSMLETFTEHTGKVALECGDLWQANQSILINCAILFQFGYPLRKIYDRLMAHSGDFLRNNNKLHWKQASLLTAIIVRLTGYRSPDDPFATEDFDEPVHGDEFNIVQEAACMLQYIPGYLFGEYTEANKALIEANAILESRKDNMTNQAQYFYESLVWAQLYEEASYQEQKVYRANLQRRLKKLKRLAHRSPTNYQHKYLFIQAEVARLKRKRRLAEQLYEQSIETARTNDHIHDLAMAAECYGKYGLRLGKLQLAKIYMTEAYESYLQWGADLKAADLEQKYGHLLQFRRESGLESVDSLAVVMSAQALSGEMEMGRLLDNLMRIMLHNAGADSGALIFDHEGRWMVEAYGNTEKLYIESVPLEEESDIVPAAIIGYAARTKEEVVLHDASNEGMFARNPFVRGSGLRSVLCLPIMHQNRLVCLLYMENKLSAGVFTPQRLKVLKLLGSQCAISIVNAKLFSGIQYLKNNLEDQVEERTRSLERSMRETSAALAEVSIYEERNRIAHEIHDIVGHTLTSTLLQIEAGKRLIHKDVEGATVRLKEAQDLVRHSLNEIRGSIHMLKEDKYTDLAHMLNQLIRDTERNMDVVIHAAIHEIPELSTGYKKTIYHALQEGLTNGIRHGDSKEFRFSLQTIGTYLQFRLEDHGKGTAAIVLGFGLKAMKERVEQLGGSLSIDSQPNKGCLLRIDLPNPM